MSFSWKKSLLVASGAVIASIALAHHIQTPLSSAYGTEILTKIKWYTSFGNEGVPAYHVGDDHHTYVLQSNSTFSVHDHGGATQSVTFDASQFASLAAATPEEVADAINAQLTIGRALVDNNTIVIRGVTGGSNASLDLVDGAGSPLATLGLAPATVPGSDAIDLTLSIPLEDEHEDTPAPPHEDLAHHPYLVIASATPGTTVVDGHEIPLALDAFTTLTLRGTQLGKFPGFVGELDDNSDATATFDAALAHATLPGGLPPRLYFAYVVFSEELDAIEFVSNAFEVEVE